MPLELTQPDPPADEQLPALAVVERIEETRDVARRYIDGLVEADRKPGLPFEVQRRTFTRNQDDILAAERLAKERQQ
jgi:hypothetical protein